MPWEPFQINSMKQIFFYIFLMTLILSCQPSTGSDPENKLKELIAQREELNVQISSLEKQLLDSGLTVSKNTLVAVEGVKINTFNHFVKVQGRVESDQDILFRAQSSGTVNKVLVKTGDQVQSGQLLVQLDAAILENTMAEAKTQLVFATTMFAKRKNLWDQKIGSEVEYLTSKANKESLENRMRVLQEQVKLTRISAVQSGVVDDVMVKVGQQVMPGAPITRVLNLKDLKVVAEVSEAHVQNVKKGNNVIVDFPDINESVQTTIMKVSSSIDEITRTFKIEVDLNKFKKNFSPNMVAIVKINDYSNPKAISIPQNLVQKANGEIYIYLASAKNNGTAIKKNIVLGRSYNGTVEVLEGLVAGDLIVIQGYQDLNVGEPINTMQN
ncbi:MAG: RND family efflux transporter MFP subunit [Sphingobacteriales bacterium]|jgi:RND family efflux transporter MFP subunit